MNKDDWLTLGREVLAIEEEGLAAVRSRLDGGFTDALALLAACRGRVVVSGVGKSGLVGRKIAATLSSTGTPAFFLHPVEGAHGDLGMIRREDVALVISNSGETDELNAIIPTMRSLGVHIIGLTGAPCSTMGGLSDVVIDASVPREACPLGLAPTASTTAALAVGDALAVCLIRWKKFGEQDFRRFHPGGALGQRLSRLVSEIMQHENLPLVPEAISLQEALDAMTRGRLGTVMAVDGQGKLAGILTDGDVRRLVCRGPFDVHASLADFMTRNPARVTPADAVAKALDLMEEKAITVLPVVQAATDDTPVGIVHMHDLLGKGRLKFSA